MTVTKPTEFRTFDRQAVYSALLTTSFNGQTRASSWHLESARTVCDESRADLGDAVREREFEVRNEELLDVWPPDVIRLLNLNYTKNLNICNSNG